MRPEPALGAAPGGDPDLPAVAAAQADRAAFAVLYRRYLDRVYAYAFYQLGDHHDAEDATARTFADALRGLASFRPNGSSFRAWLFTVAHHTIANVHRHRARRRTVPLPDDFDRSAPNADPARMLDRADRLRTVMAAVRSLPDDRRQVVLLRFVEGLSSAEIGDVLGRSPGAVRVLLHRALRDLGSRIADE
ncbi:MAG TPA: sigma-70 family RNA polymerase sigma factor [Candidatus Limnocylindria bacterium]